MKAIVISATSGIGEALSNAWTEKGWEVHGTSRKPNGSLIFCDLLSLESITTACEQLKTKCPKWDILVFAAGAMEPIGPFENGSFDEWENGIQINLLRQLRILHELLPYRNREEGEPSVLFFAGGGTNNAVTHYSSYAISKIALTKMTEFLDAEIPDTRFVIVGPGWVNTKIHESTLRAGAMAGANFQRTQDKIDSNSWVSMDRVIDCCTWLVTTHSKGVRGRNFSVANDAYATRRLEVALEDDPDMYKLRRHKNSWGAL